MRLAISLLSWNLKRQLTSLINHSTVWAWCVRVYTTITSYPACQLLVETSRVTHFLLRQAKAVVSTEIRPYQSSSPSQLSTMSALWPCSPVWAYESALSSWWPLPHLMGSVSYSVRRVSIRPSRTWFI